MISSLMSLFGASCTEHTFFGLNPWYHYLNAAGKMEVENGACTFVRMEDGFTVPDLALIGLGILDILLRVAGLVAVGFVIYGGIQFITSQGETAATKKARQTIINSFIGLMIAMIATGVVAFIGTRLGGGISDSGLPTAQANSSALMTMVNIVLAIMGAVAVLIITLAGFRYVLSRGNPQETAQAKNAIIYALVGLVVIILAFSIVNFVVSKTS